ncbi:MAG TPA: peptide-methionine (S)-S-oxide reductase [Firmicutes bacterium]|nr:peptide-methionine (S)-S-oxide reductase [Bacillota bacterium]
MEPSIAIFAAGCFWGVEKTFRNVDGVLATTVGYIGGHVDHPSYEHVCTGVTDHAEAVRINYDPARVSYEELLDVFWSAHDPTQLNRQGPDIGRQYRSAIFPQSDEQRSVAEASLAKQQAKTKKPIATQIESSTTFWPAEDYHQQYLEKRGRTS